MGLRATANLDTGFPAPNQYTQHVTTQPLYARNVVIGGVSQDVVYVADSKAQVWSFTPDLQLVAGLPGGNPRVLEPPFLPANDGGVLGTPVLDLVENRMYVVTRSTLTTGDPTHCPGTAGFWLHALDLGTMLDDDGVHGTPRLQICATAVNGDVTNVFQADRQSQRPALLLNGSYLYVTFGAGRNAKGTEGATCQHGWVMTYDVSQANATTAPTLVGTYVSSRFADTPGCPDQPLNTIGNVGIWMSGTGPAADPAGNVYIMTSNGANDSANDANALVQLSPAGARVAMYQPAYPNYATGADLDFGSAGPIVVDSAEPRIIAVGKLGHANVIAGSSMLPVAPSDVVVSSSDWTQVDPSNCSTTPLCDDAGVPNGGPNICCPAGCDDPDPTNAWSLIQNRIPGLSQPLCAAAVSHYFAGTWSNPVFWNNRVYLWPQADFLSYVPWDANNHSFGWGGQVVHVSAMRLPYFDPADKAPCQYGDPICQVYGSSDGDMVLSVNQDDLSSAVLFAATWGGYDGMSPNLRHCVLYAFDPNAQNAAPLWTSGDTGLCHNFTYPIVADGGLYVTNEGQHTADGWWPPQIQLYY
jgi:hypothetical protein